MGLRAIVRGWIEKLQPFFGLLLPIGLAVAIAFFLPLRTAAVALGILAGGAICFLWLKRMAHTIQIAVLWASIGVCADAAYAKLNDLVSVTVAGALVKAVDGIVKLAEIFVRSLGVPLDSRAKIATVTPEFVWALILSMVLFLLLSFYQTREAVPEQRYSRR